MGWLDIDEFFFITDRKKDMIISGRANISSTEIEASLMATPFIADVAAFGAPDPEFKERIVAAIQSAEKWAPIKPKSMLGLTTSLHGSNIQKSLIFTRTYRGRIAEEFLNAACANPIGTARAAESEALVCHRKTPAIRISCF